MMNFKNLNLINPIIRAATEAGYSKPAEIQYKAIPHILKGQDVLGYTMMDTEKTAAFVMPIIQLLKKETPEHNSIRVLILTPTRELAVQIEESFTMYSKYLPLSLYSVYRGNSQGGQLAALKKRIDILIATPEGLMDLVQQRPINFSKIEVLIIDEADKMLDLKLTEEVNTIINSISQRRQTLLFSATLSSKIKRFADSVLKNPVEIKITSDSSDAQNVQQSVYFVNKIEKIGLLINVLEKQSIMNTLVVFVRDKQDADRLVKQLTNMEISSEAIHGSKSQEAIQKIIQDFKNNKIQILVSTDLAAREIEMNEFTFVVNYELPDTADAYIHRITKAGRVVSFCTEDEHTDLKNIEKLIGFSIPVAIQNNTFQYLN